MVSKRYPAYHTFLLRLSPELYGEVEKCASQDRRSVNNWLVGVIADAVSAQREKREDKKEDGS